MNSGQAPSTHLPDSGQSPPAVPLPSSPPPEAPPGWLDSLTGFLLGTDIFISYAQRDSRDYAISLAAMLRARGYLCFLDSRSLAPGAELDAVLQREIRKCSTLALIASPIALQKSKWVRLEFDYAIRQGRGVIPVLIGGPSASKSPDPFVSQVESSRVFVPEAPDSFRQQRPSWDVVNGITQGLSSRRKLVIMSRGLLLVGLLLAVLTVAAVFIGLRTLQSEHTLRQESARLQAQLGLLELTGGRPLRAMAWFDEAALRQEELGEDPSSLRLLSAEARRHPGVPLALLDRHLGPLSWAGFDPERPLVRTMSRDGALVTWALPSGRHVRTERLREHPIYPGLGLQEDGLLTGPDGSSRMLEFPEGPSPSPPEEPARRGAVLGHGRQLLLTYDPDSILLWRFPDLAHPVALARSPEGEQLLAVEFSPDEAFFVTLTRTRSDSSKHSGTARLWSARGQLLKELEGRTRSVHVSPAGGSFVLLRQEDTLTAQVWSADPPRLVRTQPAESVWWRPDGQALLLAGMTGCELRRSDSGELLASLGGCSGPLTSATFSRDGGRLLTIRSGNLIDLWDATSGRHLATLEGHTAPCRIATFSPDGQYLLSACDDGDARLWRTLRQGTQVLPSAGATTGAPGGTSAALAPGETAPPALRSPDGTRLATVSAEGTVRLEEESGATVSSLEPRMGRVVGLAFSPDSALLATGGEDGSVRLWEASSGMALGVLDQDTARVRQVAFSREGDGLVARYEGGREKRFELSWNPPATPPPDWQQSPWMIRDGNLVPARPPSTSPELQPWMRRLLGTPVDTVYGTAQDDLSLRQSVAEELQGLRMGEERASPYQLAHYAFVVDLRMVWVEVGRPVTPASVAAQADGLMHRGLIRLETPAVVLRTRTLEKLLQKADTPDCAALVRGSLDERETDRLFSSLDKASLKAWFGMARQSVEAELRQVEPKSPSAHELMLALREIARRLPESERGRFGERLRLLRSNPDSELCQLGRTLYSQALELEEPHRSNLGRFLLSL